MALFPYLEFEDQLQVLDKTRIEGVKSYASTGATAMTTMTLQPGLDETPFSIFSSTVNNRYSDWEFDVRSFDIDATNNKIDFTEGAGELTATISGGTYDLPGLLTEIALQLGTTGAGVYTVTSDPDDKITIASTVNFTLLPVTGSSRNTQLLKHIGFTKDTLSSVSVKGSPVEYGIKKISLVVGDGTSTATLDRYLKLYSESGDRLFTTDQELQKNEADILKWVKPGRNTFKSFIRRSQTLILDWLDNQGFTNIYQEKFTKHDLIDISEVREWSTYMTLRLIFEDQSNAVDDIFASKANTYAIHEKNSRNRFLRIDIDKDGRLDTDENIRVKFGNLLMR